jgi:hypothetical protein
MTLHTDSHSHVHDHVHAASRRDTTQAGARVGFANRVLAWPAWLRVAAITPIIIALWLAVLWANEGLSLW